jgi:hypothetical protein
MTYQYGSYWLDKVCEYNIAINIINNIDILKTSYKT